MSRFSSRLGLSIAAFYTTVTLVHANEGMWLFNNVPTKQLKEKFGFAPDAKWLDHVQKSSVRFNSGGSGSFVSPDGLVMTNHHVARDGLQKISTATKNIVKDGFYAATRDEEIKLVDLELNVLMSIEDVTSRVNAAVKPDMSPADAAAARRKIIAEIQKESMDKTGLRSNVVTLYQGGEYHLYRFKKYTDVRLVFAPDEAIASFGGDPDNFEFPRYDLDMTFVRVYEDGKPVKPEHYLKWSAAGTKENELIFVSGHPGRTSRAFTMAELEYVRDFQMPMLMNRLNRLEVLLSVWAERNDENARRADATLKSVQNSRKARLGGLAGLMTPSVMARKAADEKQLRAAVAADPKLKDVAGAWDKIAKAVEKQRTIAVEYNLWEGGAAFNNTLFTIARNLVRGADERSKPNGERLSEFVETNLESLTFQLFSEEPIYEDLEQLKLADGLSYAAELLGFNHPMVQKVLAGKSPKDRAADLIKGTKLKDVAVRKALWEGGRAAIDNAADPMIVLAKAVDAEARAVRKTQESEITEVKQQAHAQIAKAKYALQGSSVYPDATFTLRLAFGTVKGYDENGKPVAPYTDFEGLYNRSDEHKNKEPFNLTPRWFERKSRIDMKTPFNFVSTADIIGGNSGSPVINQNGEVVGLIFDGNIQSLVLDYAFEDQVARAVSVDSRGIIESLRKVFDAGALADELQGPKK